MVPVVAGAPDEQAEVDLARARCSAASRSRAQLRVERPPVARARAARRARRPACRSPPAPRGRGRGCPARRPGRARASGRAPCGGARSRCWTSARSAGVGRGAAAGQADEHGVDVRHGVEDGTRYGAQDPDVARELGEHARHAVGGACPDWAANRAPTSFCTIATQVVTCGRSVIVRRITVAATPYGRFATTFVGTGSSAARSSLTASARWSVVFGCGSSASRSAGSSAAVQLDHVDVGDALREVLRQHAEAAADLEHDVVRAELRGPRDHVEQVRVDQEVLAEVALGADAERLHPPQARLGGEVAHQPSRRALLACTAASSSS